MDQDQRRGVQFKRAADDFARIDRDMVDGSPCLFLVRDQGIGINLEDQKRIFERFERAMPGNNIHGLGLGLYIAKSIIHLHHGQITVKSSPGEGSEFTVTLPCNIP